MSTTTTTSPTIGIRSIDRSLAISGHALSIIAIGVVSLAIAAAFLLQEHRLLGVWGMPLDDAWIHFRVAQNLATGHGFGLNPDQTTSASTSPLWTALLAAGYLLTHQFIAPSIGLGVLAYLAGNIAVYRIALAIKPDVRLAVAAGLLSAVAGRWVWSSLSGMETTLFTAVSLWGILLHRSSPRAGAALLGIAALLRPEGFVILALAIGIAIALDLRSRRGLPTGELIRLALRGSVGVLSVALVAAVCIRVGYTLSTGGGLLGNTFTAQSLPQGGGPYTGPRLIPDLWYWRSAIDVLRLDLFLLGILIPLGMLHCARLSVLPGSTRAVGWLALAWFILLPIMNAFVAPNLRHHERYLMPLIPLAVLFGAFGLDFLVHHLLGVQGRLRLPFRRLAISSAGVFVVLAGVAFVDGAVDARRWAIQYSGDVRSIQAVNVRLGEWIRDNTPPDAYIAMNDIGAISFISQRRVLDTVGIAEPEILPVLKQSGRQGVLGYLEQKRPDYVVIFPDWYPELAARTDLLTPIMSASMDDPLTATRATMLGGRQMVVYKATWP